MDRWLDRWTYRQTGPHIEMRGRILKQIEWPFLKQTHKIRKKLVLGDILVHVGSWGVTPTQPIFRDIDLATYRVAFI